MYYFAYGSNMSLARIQKRVPSAAFWATAKLEGYRLCFHMRGIDGSAKCDAFYSGHKDDAVLGVVFDMSEAELPILDQAESLGTGYESKWVKVTLDSGEDVMALVYVALHIDRSLKPFDWYKQHVVKGAKEAELPKEYVAQLEAVGAIPDPDQARSELEHAIHSTV